VSCLTSRPPAAAAVPSAGGAGPCLANLEPPGRVQDGAVEALVGPSKTPLLYDFENFHPDPGGGGFGGKNVLCCDGSVTR